MLTMFPGIDYYKYFESFQRYPPNETTVMRRNQEKKAAAHFWLY